jgi:hypothetical protein
MHVSATSRRWPFRGPSRRSKHLSTLLLVVLAVMAAALPSASSAASPATLTQPVTVTPLPASGLKELLSGVPLQALPTADLKQVIAGLPGLSGVPSVKLGEAVGHALTTLGSKGDTVGDLLSSGGLVSQLLTQLESGLSVSELLALLKGGSLTTLLSTALGTTTPESLLGGVLGQASSPGEVLSQILGAANQPKLEELIGAPITGVSFVPSTVSGLAGELGMTVSKLGEAVGTSLSSTALTLSGGLLSGKTLTGLIGPLGLNLSLLGGSQSSEEGGGGGGSGSGGSGGSGSGGTGGLGGAGGSEHGGTGSVAVTVLSPSDPTTSPASTATAKPAAALHLTVVSRKYRRGTVTLVLRVPHAGTVRVTGAGLGAKSLKVSKASQVTVRVKLTKAETSSLKRVPGHHKKMTVSVLLRETGRGQLKTSTTLTV